MMTEAEKIDVVAAALLTYHDEQLGEGDGWATLPEFARAPYRELAVVAIKAAMAHEFVPDHFADSTDMVQHGGGGGW